MSLSYLGFRIEAFSAWLVSQLYSLCLQDMMSKTMTVMIRLPVLRHRKLTIIKDRVFAFEWMATYQRTVKSILDDHRNDEEGGTLVVKKDLLVFRTC